MRVRRGGSVSFSLLWALLAVMACDDPDTQSDRSGDAGTAVPENSGEQTAPKNIEKCPAVSGRFEPLYEQLSGDCGPLQSPAVIPVHGGVSVEDRVGISIETHTEQHGCSFWFQQRTRSKTTGLVEQEIAGATLTVESENQLVGLVTLERRDEQQVLLCTGEYHAVLVKMRDLGEGL